MKTPINILLILTLVIAAFSCNKGEKNENNAPETLVVPKAINLSGEQRLKSTVRLAWFGTDVDGFVKGYEISLDNQNWSFTTKTDSTFIFKITAGQDTADIQLWVRAIDNLDVKDPTPAKVTVPIKNTPPNIEINKNLSTADTALLVASIFWEADDPDGAENLKGFEIKINDGDWLKLPKKLDNVSITPSDPTITSITTANVYSTIDEQVGTLTDLRMEDTNYIYMRSYDLSDSYSEWDTVKSLFFKGKKSDLLVVGGDRDRNKFYTDRLSNVVSSFDYVDYTANDGANQPTFWNPTFTLMALQYDKLFIYSDKTSYLNGNTGQQNLILESAAGSIDDVIKNGGKAFIIGYFENPLDNQSNLFEVLNIQSIDSLSKGLFLKPSANSLTAQESGYPDLGTRTFPDAVSPFLKQTNVISIYEGQFDVTNGYTGSNTVGIKKINESNGKTYQVFVSASMAIMDHNYSKVDSLFNHVINTEFNW